MKKIISFVLVTILLTSSCFAAVFSDVNGHWAQISILNAYYKGLVSGYSDGTFGPNNTITRAEFITILSKVLDSSIIIDIDSYEDIFTYPDLPDSHWCKPFYNKLVYYGYVFSNDNTLSEKKGRDFITSILGNLFKPNEPITRAEAVSLIAYFLDEDDLDEENTIYFSDIDSSPLKEEIIKFCKTGIVKGYSDGTFKPDNTITRAEVCKIIYDIFVQSFYFKDINWINEDSIDKIYSELIVPENILLSLLHYETHNQYELSYQLLSANYKLANNLYSYKDYMKKEHSHVVPNLILPEEVEINRTDNKDGSITFSFNDVNNQKYSVDLLLAGTNWYINSKLY